MPDRPALPLSSLAFRTLDEERQGRLAVLLDEAEMLELHNALEALAGDPTVPRLVKLDLVVRLAVRRPDEIELNNGEVRLLLRSVVPGPAGRVAEQVEVAYDALRGLADAEGPDHAWDRFVLRAGTALGITTAERNKPRCNDRDQFPTKSPKAKTPIQPREIAVAFESPYPVSDFVDYVDPVKWPDCSIYFKGMVPVGERIPFSGAGYTGWEATYWERCEAIPGRDLETPLRFVHRRANDWSFMRTSYELVDETDDILFDSGFIEVADLGPDAPPERKTRVTATKVIDFVDKTLDEWPELACDTFWMELAINMAVGCRVGGDPSGRRPTSASATGMPPGQKLKRRIDIATKHAADSFEAYAGYSKTMVDCLAGPKAPDHSKLTSEINGLWAHMLKDTAYCWLTLYGVAQDVADLGPAEDVPGKPKP